MRAITVIFLVLAATTCPAEELIQLKNGFTLKAHSHTQQDSSYIFQVGSGTIQLAAADIASIEVSPDAVSTAAHAHQAPKEQAPSPEALVAKAAAEQALDANFVRSVAKIESGFQAQAVSAKGALGLMQLMPRTAAQLGVDALRPEENARGGARYLRDLLLQYHGNSALALAAYNAGPGAVSKYGGVPPYAETRRYIVKVTREYDSLQKAAAGSATAR